MSSVDGHIHPQESELDRSEKKLLAAAQVVSPEERLERSRQALRQFFNSGEQGFDSDRCNSRAETNSFRTKENRVVNTGESIGQRSIKPERDTVRRDTALQVSGEVIREWWLHHPWRPIVREAKAVTSDLTHEMAERHPLGLIALAGTLGALAVWAKPWRGFSGKALLRGVLFSAGMVGMGVKAGGAPTATTLVNAAVHVASRNFKKRSRNKSFSN